MPKSFPAPGRVPRARGAPPRDISLDKAQRGVDEAQQAVKRMRETVEDARRRLNTALADLDEIRRRVPASPNGEKAGSGVQ